MSRPKKIQDTRRIGGLEIRSTSAMRCGGDTRRIGGLENLPVLR